MIFSTFISFSIINLTQQNCTDDEDTRQKQSLDSFARRSVLQAPRILLIQEHRLH